MAKFVRLARVYFDDKDIADIFGSGVFTKREIIQYARDRGVLMSYDEDIKEVINYVSRLGFDWMELEKIAAKLDSNSPREKTVPYRLPAQIELSTVDTAFARLKAKRPRETYALRKVGDKAYDIDVKYVDTDTSKSLAFQREEKKFVIELEEINGQLRLRSAHGEKPSSIVQQFISCLREQNKESESCEVEEIRLTSIRDPKIRTRFFLLLIESLKNFTTKDVKDLKLDSRFPAERITSPSESDNEVDEESERESSDGANKEESAEEEEIKSLVRRAVLTGQALTSSELYQSLGETGFFISGLTWTAKETTGDERLVEFEAGFDDPINADGYNFGVKRIYQKRDDGSGIKKEGSTPSAFERRKLNQVLEEGSYAALAALRKEIEKKT